MLITNALFKRRSKGSLKKPTMVSWILKVVKWILVVFFVSSLSVVVIYKFINPPVTPLMIIRVGSQISKGEKLALKKDWTPIEKISPNMIRAVIAAEDNLFVRHHGFDARAIEQAMEHNLSSQRIRGGSTISQQTAKNVFLWPDRSYLRKGLEVYFTFLIEKIWGKKRIMEVYLNVIETGNGIYGVEKASQIYFQKNSSGLSPSQAALVAAILPSPRRYSVSNPGPYVRSRQAQLVDLMPNIETLKID